MPIYRKMTFLEKIFGRESDTAEVVVYKNLTLSEWFYGTKPKQRRLIATQRTLGILLGIILFVMILVHVFNYVK